MIISYNIFSTSLSWDALTHQFNGDTLRRHVLMKGDLGGADVSFSYCEKTAKGNIINSKNDIVGDFSISF